MSYIRKLAVMAAAVVVMIVSVSGAALQDGRPVEGAGLPCSAPSSTVAARTRDNRAWVAPLDLALRAGDAGR